MISQFPIIFITGPTAVGKTDVACRLARKIDGEIVSCDSMQVYKEVSIASNKPKHEQLNQVAHHMLDVASVYDDFDVVQYVKQATDCVRNILARGKSCIVCGGTGLYLEGLLDGVFEGPKADWDLRARLEGEAKSNGNQYLYDRLKAIDAQAAQKLHPNDVRRVVRAIEIFETTGKPISYWQKQRRGLREEYDCPVFVLHMARNALYANINRRVEQMVTQGLIEEVRVLDAARISKTARQLIGIKETLMYFNNEIDKSRLIELIQQNSRNYAKRQLTWFRKDDRFDWIDIDDTDSVATIYGGYYE